MLFEVIQTITGSPINQKSFRLWKGNASYLIQLYFFCHFDITNFHCFLMETEEEEKKSLICISKIFLLIHHITLHLLFLLFFRVLSSCNPWASAYIWEGRREAIVIKQLSPNCKLGCFVLCIGVAFLATRCTC